MAEILEVDLDRVGGIPMVMKALLEAGLMHGDCLTVTGKTLAENLADIDPPALRPAKHGPRCDRTRGLGEAMVGISADSLGAGELLATRGW